MHLGRVFLATGELTGGLTGGGVAHEIRTRDKRASFFWRGSDLFLEARELSLTSYHSFPLLSVVRMKLLALSLLVAGATGNRYKYNAGNLSPRPPDAEKHTSCPNDKSLLG